MFLIHQCLIHNFSRHFIHISCNLDMIFYHQSLFDTLLSVSKLYIKVDQNKVPNFDQLKSVAKFSQGWKALPLKVKCLGPVSIDFSLVTCTLVQL